MRSGRFLVVLVTAAACGRVSFDARTDAAVDGISVDADLLALHDEDGDGIKDPDDVCPHVADIDQADNDGDRVGNACDPLTDAALERIVFFDPLIGPNASWDFRLGTPTYTGDRIEADLRDGEMFMSLVGLLPVKDHLVVGGSFGAVSATNPRQLFLAAAETDLEFLYCEKYENTIGVTKWGLVWTPDYSAFNTADETTLTSPLENGSFRTSITHVPQTSDAACDTTFPVVRRLAAPVPSSITPTKYMIYAMGVEIRIDYVIVIRTDPP